MLGGEALLHLGGRALQPRPGEIDLLLHILGRDGDDLCPVGRQALFHRGEPQLKGRFGYGDHRRQSGLQHIIAVCRLLADADLARLTGDHLRGVCDLGIVQVLRHFGTDLTGVSINRLFATEDHIELLTLLRLKNLYRAGEDVTGSQCIRAAELPAGHQERLIGTDCLLGGGYPDSETGCRCGLSNGQVRTEG